MGSSIYGLIAAWLPGPLSSPGRCFPCPDLELEGPSLLWAIGAICNWRPVSRLQLRANRSLKTQLSESCCTDAAMVPKAGLCSTPPPSALRGGREEGSTVVGGAP